MKLVFATGNKGKLREAAEILGPGFELVTPAEVGITEEIPETGSSLEENSLQKARYIYERTGLDCFADDTGLEVKELGGAPGVYTARYAGEHCNFEDNMNKLLDQMQEARDRSAQFRSVVTLLISGKPTFFEGIMKGKIATEKAGCGGFGYDPVFIADAYPDRTVAELPEDTKNAISHRGEALRKMASHLSESKKKVLVISYYWPPTGGSGVQRWVKFCKYLPSQGWKPIVYTPANPEQLARDESLLGEIPSEVEVIKTRILEPYDIYRRLTGKKKGAHAEVNPLNAQKKSAVQKLAVWIRGNFFIPDPRILWVRPSVRFLTKYLEEHPVDVIVTTGPPQSMHLIGRDVMRNLRGRSGAALPRWIVDFRDPWTKMFYFENLGLSASSVKKHKRLEKSVLDECDTIVAVSPLVQEDFKKMTSTPVELVTNGYDEDDYKGNEPVPECLEGKFVMAHTGLFASDGNPVMLWKVLSERCSKDPQFKEKLSIALAGKTDAAVLSSIKSAGLDGNMVNFGYLPHKQTVAIQKRADVLLLPLREEAESAKILPGKIFEYLAARRPVLGIGQSEGASAKVLADSGAGTMYDWENAGGIDKFVESAWNSFKQNVSGGIDGNINKYSRRELTRKMTEVFGS